MACNNPVQTTQLDMQNINLNKKMLKPLDEMLRCRICSDYFNYCVMTACSHNFCSVCIRKRMITDSDCPTCFEDIQESELRNNKLIDKVVRIYKKLRSTNDKSSDSSSQVMNSSLGSACMPNSLKDVSSPTSEAQPIDNPILTSTPIKIEIPECEDREIDITDTTINLNEDSMDSDNSKNSLPGPIRQPEVLIDGNTIAAAHVESETNQDMDTCSVSTTNGTIPNEMQTSVSHEKQITLPNHEICGTVSNNMLLPLPKHEILLIIPNIVNDATAYKSLGNNVSHMLSPISDSSNNLVSSTNSPVSTHLNSALAKSRYPELKYLTRGLNLSQENLEWYHNFTIPWDKMPPDLLTVLENKGRPSQQLRRQMIRIICNKVQQCNKKPGKHVLEIVAFKTFEKYPESLCDNPESDIANYSYHVLARQMISRVENFNRMSSKNPSVYQELDLYDYSNTFNASSFVSSAIEGDAMPQLSAGVDKASLSSDDFVEIAVNNSVNQGPAPLRKSHRITKSTPYSKCDCKHDELSACSDLSCEPNIQSDSISEPMESGVTFRAALDKQHRSSSSTRSESNLEWYESFSIPWNKMPTSLMDNLEGKQRPSPLARRVMVRIICNKVRKFNCRPPKNVVKAIAKKAFERYPDSLCDQHDKSSYNLLVGQLSNRLATIDAKRWSAKSHSYSSFANSKLVSKADTEPANLAKPVNSQTQTSKDWYKTFEIPWNEMPSVLMVALKRGDVPDTVSRRVMVRIICDRIRKFDLKPSWKVLDVIAKKVFEAFPKSLCDDPDTHVSKFTYRKLRNQLQGRLMTYFRVKVRMFDINRDKVTSKRLSGQCGESSQDTLNFFRNCEAVSITQSSELEGDYIKTSSSSQPKGKESNYVNSFSQISLSSSLESQPAWDVSNWDRFVIPWHKMGEDLLEILQSKKRPDRRMRNDMVRVICDDIRAISKNPGKKVLSQIAKRVYEAYPESISDNFCGEVVGNDYTSLINQLLSKIENLNRSERVKGPRNSPQHNLPIRNFHGYVNWRFQGLPEQETPESQQQKKEDLKLMSSSCADTVDERTLQLLDDTFYTQRLDITGAEGIESIIREWPLLFTTDGLLHHFKTLVKVDSVQKFNSSLLLKANAIFYYLMSISKLVSRKGLQLVFNELEEAHNLDKVESPAVIMLLIMAYFNEKREHLFLTVNESTTREDVEKVPELPKNPCLVICGESPFHGSSFMLSIGGIVVNDKISTFEKALVLMFTSYYVFNIPYPVGARATLEFTQRCLFGINPNKYVRISQRKNTKVVTLIKNLADYQN